MKSPFNINLIMINPKSNSQLRRHHPSSCAAKKNATASYATRLCSCTPFRESRIGPVGPVINLLHINNLHENKTPVSEKILRK